MARRAWVTGGLAALIAVFLTLLAALGLPAAQGQMSEGQAAKVIAIASTLNDANSLLYVIDTSREVVLVYGFFNTGPGKFGDLRTGSFEFLAGRLYRWDLLLASKREYALRGVRGLGGLRALGPGSTEEEYKRLGE